MRRKKRVLKRWISRFGESFTVEGSACRGVFALPPNALLRHFYTAGEIDLLGRPVWALYTLPTPYIPVGSVIVWREQSWNALKRLEFRLGNEAVYQVLILAPVPMP